MVVTAVVTAVDDDGGRASSHRTRDVMRDARARLGASPRSARQRRRAFARTSDATRLARRRARACAAARVVIDVPRGRHRIARLGDENLP